MKNNGGPAFPRAAAFAGEASFRGMSLRDYFAGKALAGAGAWTPLHGGDNLATKRAMAARAQWAYEQADAMLAEREKDSK